MPWWSNSSGTLAILPRALAGWHSRAGTDRPDVVVKTLACQDGDIVNPTVQYAGPGGGPVRFPSVRWTFGTLSSTVRHPCGGPNSYSTSTVRYDRITEAGVQYVRHSTKSV